MSVALKANSDSRHPLIRRVNPLIRMCMPLPLYSGGEVVPSIAHTQCRSSSNHIVTIFLACPS